MQRVNWEYVLAGYIYIRPFLDCSSAYKVGQVTTGTNETYFVASQQAAHKCQRAVKYILLSQGAAEAICAGYIEMIIGRTAGRPY